MVSDSKDSPKKRSGSEKRKRGPIIVFRASEEELRLIKAAADRVGLTVSSYVRSVALTKPTTRAVRRPPLATAQLAQLLGMLGIATGDLQSLLQRQGAIPASEDVLLAITECRSAASAIMRLLGKRA